MNIEPLSLLGGLTAEAFLRDYWQKKPLLVRNALPEAVNLISPDELAGLSLDEAVESQLVIENNTNDWQHRHGPFDEETFQQLPDSRWSLEVQAVDHYVPACSHLLDLFTFVPNWRIDGLMISYASNNGGIGEQRDDNDLFLIQGYGDQEWRIGEDLVQHWVLNPGDMLYLPPRFARRGIAVKESMTLAVRFRAPSHLDLLQGWVDSLQEYLPEHQRYEDGDLSPPANPGQLSDHEIDKIHDLLQRLVSDKQQLRRWLAKAMSESSDEKELSTPEEPYRGSEVLTLLKEGYPFQRDESSRFVFTETEARLDGYFINGEAVELHDKAQPLARYLAAHRVYDNFELVRYCQSAMALQLLTGLLNKGHVYIAIDDE